ncbi:MAG TPA: response regulator transcription factor, partial [Deferrisomatales bacterium]|nr:response regulator transcription factor [Deferrisomatales bacterium]
MGESRILVVDDDAELCELLVDYLSREGFRVEAVQDPQQGLARALEGEHALVVLDVMLPGMSGFEVLRRLRETSRVPVLMLTARGDDVDRIVGLEMGADDYLAKPFNPRELVARIRAVRRRTDTGGGGQRTPPRPEPVRVGDVVVDPGTREVRLGEAPVALTSVEFSLLETLLRGAGTVVSREALAEAALGRRLTAYDRSVDVHVSSLRRKLGDGSRIRTVRGVGYLYRSSSERGD